LATIERRGTVGGMVKPIAMEDRFTLWRSEYEAEVMTFIASLAGERMFFESDNSAGVSSDLRAATQIVASMEGVYGMGDGITSWLGLPQNSAWQTPDPTEKVVGRMHDRVERRLQELYDRTWGILDEHREQVLAIAAALEDKKTISGDEIAAIMGTEPGSAVTREPSGWNLVDEATASQRREHAVASITRRKAAEKASSNGDQDS
ncbi:MAG: ATPase, partial [Acidimicrobiia bacterium]|nr:ATPase [Acidimicrobiia bacterium]